MKWNIYKKFSEKEKEEWKFRFGDIKAPESNFILIIMLPCIFLGVLSLAYILKNYDPSLNITFLFTLFLRIEMAFVVIYLFQLISQFIYFIYIKNKEKKWIKEVLK